MDKIDGLDISVGLSYTGTEKIYKGALKDYYRDILKKSDLIEKYAREKLIKDYTIEVHSLKSSSKIIGATKLSDMAKELEEAGNENNIKKIEKETPELLKLYRSYLEILEPYSYGDKKILSKEEVTDDKLKAQVRKLLAAIKDFDINKAETISKKILSFDMYKEDETSFREIDSLIEELEYEQCEKKIIKWLDKL